MKDLRLVKLAENLVNYSVSLKKGEHLLINCTVDEKPLAKEIIRAAYKIGAYPYINISDSELKKEQMLGISKEQAEEIGKLEEMRMSYIDAMISITTTRNPMELSEVTIEKKKLLSTIVGKNANKRVLEGKIKWCVAIYPTPYYASCALMSLDQFEDYYFKVCCLDYSKLGNAMDVLKELLEKTDRVKIKAPGTDIGFSVKCIDKMSSKGDRNIPDGEVYTAPVRESVNGYITFNVPSTYQGIHFENIKLTFKDGKVIEVDCNKKQQLNSILNIDEGARYVGEFAFGVNPFLKIPIGTTLFDEKINGSIHFALGNALDLTDNGNKSAIHWDLVSIHRPEYGGGEIYLDDILVRKDGVFVIPELKCLNEENFN